MSASTGVAPAWMMTLTVAANVVGVVITSSPGPMPLATSARCMPAVAESSAIACFTPANDAKCSSNARTRGPGASQPERSVSTTASTSASEMSGRL